ncbi:MAG: L-ribulose-5-phosphate 4-epimerase [Planctomycetes bacterium GWF2_50_10]|nr:MAG: L-ribulose-5-phosphate 4-epimerase [Planctomycetes bacterium GWF2_50_10]
MLEELKEEVCRANLELKEQNLVLYSWGNVSGIDRKNNIIAIKPSGVAYDQLTPEKIILLDLDGKIVEGSLNPSSDTPTHLELYRRFAALGGVCHTHSKYATMWAQACKCIPCLGTTHADYFYGAVPVTAVMDSGLIKGDYELNTGRIIADTFKDRDPMQVPAVLVANHGPFTWGKNAASAVESAVVLEEVARIAFGTLLINPAIKDIDTILLDKHYLRKHGKDAYYGQKNRQDTI